MDSQPQVDPRVSQFQSHGQAVGPELLVVDAPPPLLDHGGAALRVPRNFGGWPERPASAHPVGQTRERRPGAPSSENVLRLQT